MSNIKACPDCKKSFGIFRWRNGCESCQAIRCSSCLHTPDFAWLACKSVPVIAYCNICWERTVAPVAARYNAAKEMSGDIEIFPRTYKGKLPIDERINSKMICTRAFRDQADARYSAQVTAAFLDHTALVNFRLEKGTRQQSTKNDGVYRYSVWEAMGTAVTFVDKESQRASRPRIEIIKKKPN